MTTPARRAGHATRRGRTRARALAAARPKSSFPRSRAGGWTSRSTAAWTSAPRGRTCYSAKGWLW